MARATHCHARSSQQFCTKTSSCLEVCFVLCCVGCCALAARNLLIFLFIFNRCPLSCCVISCFCSIFFHFGKNTMQALPVSLGWPIDSSLSSNPRARRPSTKSLSKSGCLPNTSTSLARCFVLLHHNSLFVVVFCCRSTFLSFDRAVCPVCVLLQIHVLDRWLHRCLALYRSAILHCKCASFYC